MRRREFLKLCSVAPFAGSLSILGQSGASETQKETKPTDGAYLKATELKCMRCGSVIPLPDGYYKFGTRVVCNCGGIHRFVAFAEVIKDSKGNMFHETPVICDI